MYIMDPCFEDKSASLTLLLWNIVRYTFPNKAVANIKLINYSDIIERVQYS